jgi:hypothetical protein
MGCKFISVISWFYTDSFLADPKQGGTVSVHRPAGRRARFRTKRLWEVRKPPISSTPESLLIIGVLIELVLT